MVWTLSLSVMTGGVAFSSGFLDSPSPAYSTCNTVGLLKLKWLLQHKWLTANQVAYSNSSGLLQLKWLTATQVAYCNTSSLLQHKWLTAAKVAYCNTSGLLKHKWLNATQMAYYNTSGLLQDKWLTATKVAYCNTSGLLQHKWYTAPQVAYCNTSGLLQHKRLTAKNMLYTEDTIQQSCVRHNSTIMSHLLISAAIIALPYVIYIYDGPNFTEQVGGSTLCVIQMRYPYIFPNQGHNPARKGKIKQARKCRRLI